MKRVGFALGYGKFANAREMADLMRQAEERGFEMGFFSDEGLDVEFRIGQQAPAEIYLLAQSSRLPLEGLFLLMDRPATAVPSQDGDMTIISRRVRLTP